MTDQVTPEQEVLAEAMRDARNGLAGTGGWYVADVVTGKWVESKFYVPAILAALAERGYRVTNSDLIDRNGNLRTALRGLGYSHVQITAIENGAAAQLQAGQKEPDPRD